MSDLISQKILQIVDQIQSAIVAKAPAALNLVLETARIQALQHVCMGFVEMILIIGCVCWFLKIPKKDEFGNVSTLILLPIIPVALLGVAMFYDFFDLFNWVGIWHPDIYLVHQFLVKAGSN